MNQTIFISISFFLFTSFSFAEESFLPGKEPKVGARISVSVTQSFQGKFQKAIWSKRIKKIKTSSDGVSQLYLLEWNIDTGADPVEGWVSEAGLGYIQNIEEFCSQEHEALSAHLEKIKLKEDMIQTCVVEDLNGSKVWYSQDVPFGVLRDLRVKPNGDFLNQYLTKYFWN